MDSEQTRFEHENLDEDIPKNHFSRFVVRFIDEFFPILGFDELDAKSPNRIYSIRNMFKLIFYSYSTGVTKSKAIEDQARYHKVFIYVCNGIKPSERTIRRFIVEYGYLFNVFLGATLLFASELNLTDFKHVSVDGTIKKANNNKFNVLHEKEIYTLLRHYSGFKLTDDEIKSLPRPARKFVERTDLSDDAKFELLQGMQTQITMSGQNTVAINDAEARWMNNKQGIKEISYNVQNAVDTETKLICAIKVSQSPTDHYELPDIVKKLMKNINDKPDYVSADTGYHNETSFQFLKKHEIKPLIPDRRQTRENTGRLSENPFHKDHFKYIMDEDVFICPNKHKLEFKQQIIHKKEEDDKPYKIERRYWNYEACKDCEDKDKCCKSTLRQITEFASPEALETKRKMKTDEYKKLFKKRSSTVEAPFGTLKVFYRMNEMQVKGLKQTENLLTLFAITYNLKILYGFNNSIFDEIEDLNLFKERIQALFNIECEFHEKKSE